MGGSGALLTAFILLMAAPGEIYSATQGQLALGASGGSQSTRPCRWVRSGGRLSSGTRATGQRGSRTQAFTVGGA